MIDFDQLKRDREAGTKGPWLCHFGDDAVKCDCPYILAEYGGMGSIAEISKCEKMEGPWGDDNGPSVPESKANARRIARVPELEALALAGRELAAAADDMDDVAEHDIDNSGNGWVGMPYGEFKALMDALAAWDKTVKGEGDG